MIGVYMYLCLILTRNAFSQSISWTVGTSVPRFNEPLKLYCAVASAGCCTSFSRVWENGTGELLLSDGKSTNPEKYAEDWIQGSTAGFSLIIKNLQVSDVGKNYRCQYQLINDNHTLTQNATWEFVPTETGQWKGRNGILTGMINVPRAAPYPSIFAFYGDDNMTADLTITGPTNFETWFYNFSVSINATVTCIFTKKFTLSVVTGTTTKVLFEKFDMCLCLDSGKNINLYEAIGHLIVVILLVIMIIIYYKCKKNYEDFKKEFKEIAAAYGIVMNVSFGANAIIACIAGPVYCHDDNAFWICSGLITSIVGSVIAVSLVKNVEIGKYASILIYQGVVTFVIGVIDLSVIADYLNGQSSVCGFKSFGFAILGSTIMLFGNSIFLYYKKLNAGKSLIFSSMIFFMSLVVDFAVAFPLGTYVLLSNGWYAVFILLGILYSIISLAVFWFGSVTVPNIEVNNYTLLSLIAWIPLVGFIILLLCSLAGYFKGDKDSKKSSDGGNTESAKSGSSCWPPCRVDQDPETRSFAPVNVGRSSERPTPNKEKEKRPVARVSSQPQTAHHVKTENTASAVSSTEKEPFKPRPLPNIVMNTETSTPRPLPKMPLGTQQEKASNKLDPIETTAEKKKKKKRRKKETDQTKQTEMENSTEL